MARISYSSHLRSIPLFARCTTRQLEEIGQVADEVKVPEGKTLCRQGEVGMELLVVLEGTAEVIKDDVVVNEVGPGHFIGEMAVLSDARRNATVVANSEMTVLALTRIGLDQLLEDVPGLAKHLLFEVVSRVAYSDS